MIVEIVAQGSLKLQNFQRLKLKRRLFNFPADFQMAEYYFSTCQ